jgi:hypothetical protein
MDEDFIFLQGPNAYKWFEKLPVKEWIPISKIPCGIFWSVWEEIETRRVDLSPDYQQFKKLW